MLEAKARPLPKTSCHNNRFEGEHVIVKELDIFSSVANKRIASCRFSKSLNGVIGLKERTLSRLSNILVSAWSWPVLPSRTPC